MRRRARRGRYAGKEGQPDTRLDYRALRNPFPPMETVSSDCIAAMQAAGRDVRQSQSAGVLHAEARTPSRGAGARVHDGSEMVLIGRKIPEAAPAEIKIAPDRHEAVRADIADATAGGGAAAVN